MLINGILISIHASISLLKQENKILKNLAETQCIWVISTGVGGFGQTRKISTKSVTVMISTLSSLQTKCRKIH